MINFSQILFFNSNIVNQLEFENEVNKPLYENLRASLNQLVINTNTSSTNLKYAIG